MNCIRKTAPVADIVAPSSCWSSLSSCTIGHCNIIYFTNPLLSILQICPNSCCWNFLLSIHTELDSKFYPLSIITHAQRQTFRHADGQANSFRYLCKHCAVKQQPSDDAVTPERKQKSYTVAYDYTIRTLLTTSWPPPSSLSRNPNGAPPFNCIVHSPSPTSTSGDVTAAILVSLSDVGVAGAAAVYVSCSSMTAVEQRQAGQSRDRPDLLARSISSSVRAVPLIRGV